MITKPLSQGNNSVFLFGFADSAASVPFAIDPNTGVITVSSSLDYETTQQYSFMVCTVDVAAVRSCFTAVMQSACSCVCVWGGRGGMLK